MTVSLSNEEIEALIDEPKVFPKGYEQKLRLKPKRGHKETDVDLEGTEDHEFRLIMRKSQYNALDFSVIVGYLPKKSNVVFRLRRYNGSSHDHTNTLKDQVISGFHIHKATERYQERGFAEDSFAEATDRYSNIEEALRCAIEDCNIRPGDPDQTTIEGALP